MNSSSFALEPISQDGVLVTIALALAGILALLTLVGMLWGARLKRRRNAAQAEEERRMEQLRSDGVAATNTAEGTLPATPEKQEPAASQSQAQTRSSPPPVAPAPPPLSDAPVVGTAPLPDEPIPAAAPFDASPAATAAAAPVAVAAENGAAPVSTLKGLGPKIAARLSELGITRVDQLAWLDDAEAADLDAQMGAFQGRIERDRWREQARLLADGDRAGYEAQFGKLG